MATFSIDNTSGHITLKKCLDYETNNYYQFNVTAYVSFHKVYKVVVIAPTLNHPYNELIKF